MKDYQMCAWLEFTKKWKEFRLYLASSPGRFFQLLNARGHFSPPPRMFNNCKKRPGDEARLYLDYNYDYYTCTPC